MLKNDALGQRVYSAPSAIMFDIPYLNEFVIETPTIATTKNGSNESNAEYPRSIILQARKKPMRSEMSIIASEIIVYCAFLYSYGIRFME